MALELELSTTIKARAARVWREISDISTHGEWMHGVTDIRITSSKHEGTGMTYECDTHVAVLSTTDRLLVTQWIDGRSFTVNHEGTFNGIGTFSVVTNGDDTSTVTRSERLNFPWYFAGPLGELIGRPVLDRIWTADLHSLKDRCEHEADVNPLAFFANVGQKVTTRRVGEKWAIDIGENKDYGAGDSAYGARYAAVKRWQTEHS